MPQTSHWRLRRSLQLAAEQRQLQLVQMSRVGGSLQPQQLQPQQQGLPPEQLGLLLPPPWLHQLLLPVWLLWLWC